VAGAKETAVDLSAAALQRASAGLGVDKSALRLFELREVPPGAQLAEDVERVAVAIVGSSASSPSGCYILCASLVVILKQNMRGSTIRLSYDL
jgi:hypothetical protein